MRVIIVSSCVSWSVRTAVQWVVSRITVLHMLRASHSIIIVSVIVTFWVIKAGVVSDWSVFARIRGYVSNFTSHIIKPIKGTGTNRSGLPGTRTGLIVISIWDVLSAFSNIFSSFTGITPPKKVLFFVIIIIERVLCMVTISEGATHTPTTLSNYRVLHESVGSAHSRISSYSSPAGCQWTDHGVCWSATASCSSGTSGCVWGSSMMTVIDDTVIRSFIGCHRPLIVV
mmetsp:Transcript_2890/g.4159  ORF Transcript_2890/g.4159 Transcript_2890/m.4159 type:complete len:228 (-) Transcript_2890:3-686(-)